MTNSLRPPYSLADVRGIYELPLTTLIYKAQEVHHRHQDPAGVQLCTLQSIKTGSCSEDCGYCPQSARYDTEVKSEALMGADTIVERARAAKAGGASRFCMGAAWRNVRDNQQFESVLDSVRAVADLDLEVCCTLGMLDADQARRLKEAGCTVYNHNLDTSREYYGEVVTTRTYDDRLETLRHVREADLEVCCGGIIGMGEAIDDRLKLLAELAGMDPQPESVPINALVGVEGTPMADQPPVDGIEFVRIVATARILMPSTIVRLSAGRTNMSREMQALCFVAGANSIFLGEKLLTTPNPDAHDDNKLLSDLGLHALHPDESRERRTQSAPIPAGTI